MGELVILKKDELQTLIKNSIAEAVSLLQSKQKQKVHFTKKEAAEYLSLSQSTINRLMQQNCLEFKKVGKKVIFSKKDLDNFLQKHKSTATQPVTSTIFNKFNL